MICRVMSTSTTKLRFLNNPFELPDSTNFSHEIIFTTTGESYSCGVNQWTKASSIGFVATHSTLQTPASSTQEAFRLAAASIGR